ncbi:sec1-like family protein [Nannochloropsis oceanica]
MSSSGKKVTEESPLKHFRDVVQRRLMRDVIEAAAGLSRGWMVMVIDDAALRVVSALVGMYDVMEHRVTLIELLSKKRQPLPEMEVIYLVTPTLETINLILKDFSDPKRPRYGAVHLFFLSKVNDTLMQRLGTAPNLSQRVQTFKEVNMNFLATEASAFHLDMPRCLPGLFSSRPDDTILDEVVDKLVSLCVTLNEYPHVRFNQNSVLGARIATLVQDGLNDFVARQEDWWYHGQTGHMDRERATFLILDRAEDPLTPLIHEHTYQAIVQDLLQVEDDMITFQSEGKGGRHETKALLNESDALWTEFRHQHIAKVMEQIGERTRDYIQANAGVEMTRKLGTNAKMSPHELALIVKQLPEYREMTGKLWMHYSITTDVMARFQHFGVLDLSELEQTLATGVDGDGRSVKEEKMLQSLETMLMGLESAGMTLANKMRLIAIFIIAQGGITEEARRTLVAAAGLTTEDQNALIHLEALGVKVQKSKSGSSSMWGGQAKKNKRRAYQDSEYAASRYVCALKDLIDQIVQGELSTEVYPSVLPMPSLVGKPVARSLRKPEKGRLGKQPGSYTGARSLIFVAGGVSFSELRAAYEVMERQKKEVIIGGTSYLTPNTFVDLLRAIKI